MIARNFTYRGMKGEIDLVGYDGATLAFVEVKTRTTAGGAFGSPEDAVTHEKQQHLSRMARQFLREYRTGRRPVPVRRPGHRGAARPAPGRPPAQGRFCCID